MATLLPLPATLATGLLLVAAMLAWCFWFAPREVFLNAEMIKADGSQDSLKAGFHARRTWVRVLWWLGLALGGGLLPPLLLGLGLLPAVLAFAALGIGMAGFFAAAFTPCLNVARGLDKWYVSFAEGAANWPDSKLAADARAKWPDGDEAQQRASAGLALERLTGKIISITGAICGVLIVAFLFAAHIIKP